MRTVTIIEDGRDQVIRLPTDMAFEGMSELEISREGDVITLRLARPSWLAFSELPRADDGCLQERPVIVNDEDRFSP